METVTSAWNAQFEGSSAMATLVRRLNHTVQVLHAQGADKTPPSRAAKD